jgi:hypothetical protein
LVHRGFTTREVSILWEDKRNDYGAVKSDQEAKKEQRRKFGKSQALG